jgi:hypothetical protein
MSEATYDSVEGEAYESEAYEGEGEAYEGEAYEGEAGYEAYGEESRAQRDRRNRQWQIMLARQQQLQRQRRPGVARAVPRPAPAAAAPRPAPATLNAIRAVDLDAKVARDSLRRQLEKARRNAQWSTYSALATGVVGQALDTFEGNLADHPFVRAGLRLAPQALLPSMTQRKGLEGVLLHPAFLATAAAGGILLAGRLTNSDKSARTITITASPSVEVGDSSLFLATATDHAGRTVSGVTFTWTSSNPNVLSFANPNSGAFDANDIGLVIVTASSGDIQQSVSVRVLDDSFGRNGSSPLAHPAPTSPAAPRPEAHAAAGDHENQPNEG